MCSVSTMQFSVSSDTLLLLAVLAVLYRLNSKRIYAFRQWLFAMHMYYVGTHADQALRDMKVKPAHVGDPLRELVSFDPELRKKKQVRIVEIGVGSGLNFKDYPDGSQLILVDINDKFEPELRANLAKFPGLTLEKYYVTDAADMHEIPDGSVDAVVTQYALCSIDEVLAIMKEVKRILAPGAKYYFMEHVVDKRNYLRRFLQEFLVRSGIWGYCGMGCNCAKDTEALLRQAEFSSITVKETHLPLSYDVVFLATAPNIYGVAVK